jgi:hypothetical protein
MELPQYPRHPPARIGSGVRVLALVVRVRPRGVTPRGYWRWARGSSPA